MVRPFMNGRLDAGVNFLDRTRLHRADKRENFYPSDVQEVVGVRIPSYASVNITYRFGRSVSP